MEYIEVAEEAGYKKDFGIVRAMEACHQHRHTGLGSYRAFAAAVGEVAQSHIWSCRLLEEQVAVRWDVILIDYIGYLSV